MRCSEWTHLRRYHLNTTPAEGDADTTRRGGHPSPGSRRIRPNLLTQVSSSRRTQCGDISVALPRVSRPGSCGSASTARYTAPRPCSVMCGVVCLCLASSRRRAFYNEWYVIIQGVNNQVSSGGRGRAALARGRALSPSLAPAAPPAPPAGRPRTRRRRLETPRRETRDATRETERGVSNREEGDTAVFPFSAPGRGHPPQTQTPEPQRQSGAPRDTRDARAARADGGAVTQQKLLSVNSY